MGGFWHQKALTFLLFCLTVEAILSNYFSVKMTGVCRKEKNNTVYQDTASHKRCRMMNTFCLSFGRKMKIGNYKGL